MLETVRAENVDEKMWLSVLFAGSVPELWSLNCLTKSIFYNFVLTSTRTLSLLK